MMSKSTTIAAIQAYFFFNLTLIELDKKYLLVGKNTKISEKTLCSEIFYIFAIRFIK